MFFVAVMLLAAGLRAQAAEMPYDSGATPHDLVLMRDARRDALHGHLSDAIAKMNDVVAEAPDFADGYYVRAAYERDAGRFADAKADLDHARNFHPDAWEIFIMRATVDLRQRDAAAALADLATAAKLPTRSLWKHTRFAFTVHTMSYSLMLTSVAEQMLGHDDAAIYAFKHELDFESERPWYILGAHCYFAAAAGVLDMAELTCGEAISKQGHDIGDYDSLGLAHLKLGKFAAAIADYDLALGSRPDLTTSLYGRGIARRATGDTAGGDADIAAARQGEPEIVNIMASLGVKRG